jgi:Family of unknown function (DUF5340)
MRSVPIPSPIHYELPLQLLERQSIVAVEKKQHQEQIQQLIATLRKAVVLQRQLEETLERDGCAWEYRWSLNQIEPPAVN